MLGLLLVPQKKKKIIWFLDSDFGQFTKYKSIQFKNNQTAFKTITQSF